MIKEIYFYEEEGKLYITDAFDKIRVQFESTEARDKWADPLLKNCGYKRIDGKPDVMANLERL